MIGTQNIFWNLLPGVSTSFRQEFKQKSLNAKNSRKFVYILAKHCRSHFNLTKFFYNSYRLFYAGAVEGQMPEILSMIQVNKMTPAPAVLVVVIKIQLGKEN